MTPIVFPHMIQIPSKCAVSAFHRGILVAIPNSGYRLFRLIAAIDRGQGDIMLQSQTRATGSSDANPPILMRAVESLQSQTRATGSSDSQKHLLMISQKKVAIPNSGYRLFRRTFLAINATVMYCCNPKLGLQALPTTKVFNWSIT